MSKNSLWFPRLSSWMSAALLLVITGFLSTAAQKIFIVEYEWFADSPRFFFLLSSLAIISPIWIVAYLHHLIQLILDRLDPDGASEQKNAGFTAFIPVVMSWWEGLYAWLVLLLSTILTVGVLGTMLPWHDFDAIWKMFETLYAMLLDVNKLKYLLSPATFIWVMIAAYLYQFEHVVMLRGRQS